jgi:hypothetical protein
MTTHCAPASVSTKVQAAVTGTAADSGCWATWRRAGWRPRLTAPGTGRRPVLTLAGRLLATILHQRLALPQVAIAALFSVRPETINRRIRYTRQLLDQAGYVIQPSPRRLTSVDAEWVSLPPIRSPACGRGP